MTVLGEVFGCLQRMSLLQLLFGFLAFTGYALAQGSLVGGRMRLAASAVAGLSAVGFIADTSPWVYGVMLVAFAVAGVGIFAALAWTVSGLLGFARDAAPRVVGADDVDSAFVDPPFGEAIAIPARKMASSPRPAHSH